LYAAPVLSKTLRELMLDERDQTWPTVIKSAFNHGKYCVQSVFENCVATISVRSNMPGTTYVYGRRNNPKRDNKAHNNVSLSPPLKDVRNGFGSKREKATDME
jgi:hypothetical protein